MLTRPDIRARYRPNAATAASHDDSILRLMFVPHKLSHTWNADCRLGKQLRGENGDRAFSVARVELIDQRV